jgi:hypothetical protein
MGEFYAWAATGNVAGYESWVMPEVDADAPRNAAQDRGVHIASRMVERQHFTLHQRDGREVAIDLANSGVGMRNGHLVTLVWAAREGTAHGHCVYIENHTTGSSARLTHNVSLIRSSAGRGRLALYGVAATIPAALAMLGWLLTPGALAGVDPGVFFAGAVLAVVVLFFIGALVSKLVFDYQRTENDGKIWRAVNLALSGTGAAANVEARARW